MFSCSSKILGFHTLKYMFRCSYSPHTKYIYSSISFSSFGLLLYWPCPVRMCMKPPCISIFISILSATSGNQLCILLFCGVVPELLPFAGQDIRNLFLWLACSCSTFLNLSPFRFLTSTLLSVSLFVGEFAVAS